MNENIVMAFQLASSSVTEIRVLAASPRSPAVLANHSKQELRSFRNSTTHVLPIRGISSHRQNFQNSAAGSTEFHDALSKQGNVFLQEKEDQKKVIEKRWREFFSDPSQWWDHRFAKGNPKYPDFRHKRTSQGLWLNGMLNPSWVAAKLSGTELWMLQEPTFVWNRRLEMLVKAGQNKKAVKTFYKLQREGIRPDRFTFVTILRACSRLRALREGQYVHEQIVDDGLGSDDYINSCLVDMYAKCGSLDDAQRLFYNMSTRNVISWNSMILGHVKCGQGQKALELSREMLREKVEPDTVTFVGLINACTSIRAFEEGKKIHEQTVRRGWDTGIFVGSSLIDMYATCDSIENACRVFDKMPLRDVACWNAMIEGFVKCKKGQAALDLAKRMEHEGLEPNTATFVGLFNACASMGAIEEGRRLHQQVMQRGLEFQVLVGSGLIRMYCQCGQIRDAWRVFNSMPIRNVKTWNAMIEGCVKCNRPYNVLEIFPAMCKEGVEPDVNTFAGVVQACGSLGDLQEGMLVHAQISQKGFESAAVIRISLITMYTKCRRMEDAWMVFNQTPDREIPCWNAMIHGYARCGQGHKALELFSRMRLENLKPNMDTFLAVLDACANVGALEEGKRLHAEICELGYESDMTVNDKLKKMYAKCKTLKSTGFQQLPAYGPGSLGAILMK